MKTDKNRKQLFFKVNNEVVAIATGDIYLNEIDEMKWIIVSECECSIDDIDVELVESLAEISEEIDVTDGGMIFWESLEHRIIEGVKLNSDLVEGSDEYLDALLDGSLIDKLDFFTN